MSRLLRPMFSGRTYVVVLFLATRPWLGLVYLVLLLTGLSGGLTSALALVGIPMIVLTFLAAWGFAVFERHLARWWLGVEIAPMTPPQPPGRSLWTRVRDHLSSPVTWKSILYLFLQFPAGLVACTLEVIALSAALALLLAPAWYLLDRLTYHPADVRFSGLLLYLTGSGPAVEPGGVAITLLLAAGGFVLLVWLLYLVDLTGQAWGAAAARLLGMSDAAVRLAEARSIALTERERAARADLSRRELIVNVSHELRTPIASIRAHVESLSMRDGSPPVDPETARYLEVIGREVERLSALVDDLLAVARAEAGELKLTREPVSVAQVVRHVHEALGPIARRQRKVTLVERLPEEGLPPVMADADRLTQVMMNLVRNAVTYTPEGGLVSIEAHMDSTESGSVALEVADTGIGIPPADLDRVFDRFYRTDASRARSTGGFGLGLSIARDLVEAMGGTIRVESEVDAGTRVTVRLPVAMPAGGR